MPRLLAAALSLAATLALGACLPTFGGGGRAPLAEQPAASPVAGNPVAGNPVASSPVAGNPVMGGAIQTVALDSPAGTPAPATAPAPPAAPRAAPPPPPPPPSVPPSAPPAAQTAEPPSAAAQTDARATGPEAPRSPSQIACERGGGSWSRAGAADVFACVRRTRDGGQSCTRSTQCEGPCLARSRTCSPVTPLFGCNEILQGDGSRTTLCLQ